jgi:hypothetical protein
MTSLVSILCAQDQHAFNWHTDRRIALISSVAHDNFRGYFDKKLYEIGPNQQIKVFVQTLHPMTFYAYAEGKTYNFYADEILSGKPTLYIPTGSICMFYFYGNANDPSLEPRYYSQDLLVGGKWYREFRCATPLKDVPMNVGALTFSLIWLDAG